MNNDLILMLILFLNFIDIHITQYKLPGSPQLCSRYSVRPDGKSSSATLVCFTVLSRNLEMRIKLPSTQLIIVILIYQTIYLRKRS